MLNMKQLASEVDGFSCLCFSFTSAAALLSSSSATCSRGRQPSTAWRARPSSIGPGSHRGPRRRQTADRGRPGLRRSVSKSIVQPGPRATAYQALRTHPASKLRFCLDKFTSSRSAPPVTGIRFAICANSARTRFHRSRSRAEAVPGAHTIGRCPVHAAKADCETRMSGPSREASTL